MNSHGKTHVGTATAFVALVGGTMGALGAIFWGLLLLVVMFCVAPIEAFKIVWDFSPWAVFCLIIFVICAIWSICSGRDRCH